MDRRTKAIRVAVGALVFGGVYWFLRDSQIITEFFRSSVDEGKLGAAEGNALSSLIEVVASVGGVAIMIMTRLLSYVASSIEPLFGQITDVIDNAADPVVQRSGSESVEQLLLDAIRSGDKSLAIALANHIAGSDFLSDGGVS